MIQILMYFIETNMPPIKWEGFDSCICWVPSSSNGSIFLITLPRKFIEALGTQVQKHSGPKINFSSSGWLTTASSFDPWFLLFLFSSLASVISTCLKISSFGFIWEVYPNLCLGRNKNAAVHVLSNLLSGKATLIFYWLCVYYLALVITLTFTSCLTMKTLGILNAIFSWH